MAESKRCTFRVVDERGRSRQCAEAAAYRMPARGNEWRLTSGTHVCELHRRKLLRLAVREHRAWQRRVRYLSALPRLTASGALGKDGTGDGE